MMSTMMHAQIQPDLWRMQAYGVTLDELRAAAKQAATNTTGGFLSSFSQEIMVRNLAMTTNLDDLSKTVVKTVKDQPISIGDVATVAWDTEPVRGNANVNGDPGVIMSVTKAPGFDTLSLTKKIEEAISMSGYDANETKADRKAQRKLHGCCQPGAHD